MKIVKPEAHYLGKVPTDYEGTLKFIEMAGRTCYRSEDKITPGSAEKFVRKLIAAGHLAMVEHSNFVVRMKYADPEDAYAVHLVVGKYINIVYDSVNNVLYAGGSLTAWYQQIQQVGYYTVFVPFIKLWGKLFAITTDAYSGTWAPCPFDEIPPELHRHTVRFVCDRGVSHELVRHRPCSFAQESTRYVSYGGKDMEFVEPWWYDPDYEPNGDDPGRDIFFNSCRLAEINYNQMQDIAVYNSPQACRAVLPNALRTEIVVTADAAEWAHIKKLRTAPSAHPDMRRLMSMVPWEEIV